MSTVEWNDPYPISHMSCSPLVHYVRISLLLLLLCALAQRTHCFSVQVFQERTCEDTLDIEGCGGERPCATIMLLPNLARDYNRSCCDR